MTVSADFQGLNGQIGDFLALPRSQYAHWDPATVRPLFGEGVLPGEKAFDNLPSGSVVIGHSALLHGRRTKPGGEGMSRYFVDISYCQPGRRQFPAYGSGGNAGSGSPRVLQYEIAELAKEMGHDRGGRYDHVWDTSMFCTLASHSCCCCFVPPELLVAVG